jgi:hypothetical protein
MCRSYINLNEKFPKNQSSASELNCLQRRHLKKIYRVIENLIFSQKIRFLPKMFFWKKSDFFPKYLFFSQKIGLFPTKSNFFQVFFLNIGFFFNVFRFLVDSYRTQHMGQQRGLGLFFITRLDC